MTRYNTGTPKDAKEGTEESNNSLSKFKYLAILDMSYLLFMYLNTTNTQIYIST